MINATVDRAANRTYADVPENQPSADYRSVVVWELDGRTMDTAAAEALSRRTEPRRREFKGIDSSGFFHDDSVILDDEEDFAV